MPSVVTVRVVKDEMPKMLRDIKKQQENVKAAMNAWGTILERDVKESAREAGISDYTGALQGSGVKWVRALKREFGYLRINNKYVMLDSMTPHWVGFDKGSPILAWANQARNASLQAASSDILAGRRKNAFVYVHPHPFIIEGVARAQNKLGPMLQQSLAVNVKS